MVIILVYAGVTPPVGGVLYITMGIAEVKMKDVLGFLGPYLIAVLAVILLTIMIPELSTFIPNLIWH